MTSLAMAFDYVGLNYDPGQLNTFMKENGGFAGTAVDWDNTTTNAGAAAGQTLGFKAFRSTSLDDLLQALCSGHPVIVGVEIGKRQAGQPGHFVLVTGFDGEHFTIADPGHDDRQFLDDPAYQNHFETRGYVFGGTAATMSASRLAAAAPATLPADISRLDLAADSSYLVATNSAGQSSGFDQAGSRRQEIPNSAPFLDSSPFLDPQTGDPPAEIGTYLQIAQPLPGSYRVALNSLDSNRHTLFVTGISREGRAQPRLETPYQAAPGSVVVFEVTYSSNGAVAVTQAKTSAEGGAAGTPVPTLAQTGSPAGSPTPELLAITVLAALLLGTGAGLLIRRP
jgi:hypothetical protein